MSKLTIKPLQIPKGVDVAIKGGAIEVKGPKGTLSVARNQHIVVAIEGDRIDVERTSDVKATRAMMGTTYALLRNAIRGVTEQFTVALELRGVGYRAKVTGSNIDLALGHSHPVSYSLPDGVTAQQSAQTNITLIGIDKQKVGQVAAEIRAKRPPDSYKGKGVLYAGEQLSLKETKRKKK